MILLDQGQVILKRLRALRFPDLFHPSNSCGAADYECCPYTIPGFQDEIEESVAVIPQQPPKSMKRRWNYVPSTISRNASTTKTNIVNTGANLRVKQIRNSMEGDKELKKKSIEDSNDRERENIRRTEKSRISKVKTKKLHQ
ncbi:hypothetical protein FQA39_LY06767 [Lamprigera yunnana]|nr:hypothetical protein FQA39_LY06767 [Lamprigera yunnana]